MQAVYMFVLTATSRGDDVLPPETTVVAASENLFTIETLRYKREQERSAWLKENEKSLPDYALGSITSSDDIVEVPTV